jgi:hypothetical protein
MNARYLGPEVTAKASRNYPFERFRDWPVDTLVL